MNKEKEAILMLEDGKTYRGIGIGVPGTTYGEVVFNTSMSGYQEMLTDPSYKGQILVFTYPLIGNYGINDEDFESNGVKVEGVVVKELCEIPSNHRSKKSLQKYLEENQVVGISGVDTRALTKHLRVQGVMMGIISTEKNEKELIEMFKTLPNYGEIDFVKEVSTKKIYKWDEKENVGAGFMPAQTKVFGGKYLASVPKREKRFKVVLIDLGVKYNILRLLSYYGCEVIVVPCTTSADEILSYNPEGIVFSPGPGDPARLSYVANTMKELITQFQTSNIKLPILGICLGHQCLALALGGKTFKLKFGHRGANHPVKDLKSNRCYITSQNHGYAVDAESIKEVGLEVTHLNVNDGTVEGMEMKELPVFSVQYHPEASPGPMDSINLFKKFVGMMENIR